MAQYRERMVVSGMVQGVGFRYFTCRLAQEYPVTGYVRNLPNGDVEIVAEGEDSAVDTMVQWAREGPTWAHVRNAQEEELPYQGEYRDFGVRF